METKANQSVPHAHRKFYDLPTRAPETADGGGGAAGLGPQLTEPGPGGGGGQSACPRHWGSEPRPQTAGDLCQYIADNVIGKDKVFSAPYGLRKVIYCDFTASGRSLSFLEDYIQQEVLPEYGNTHTTTTVTSLQTTLFRNEARDIVRNSIHASEHDAVIFVGSGCTAAVHKIIHALNFSQPPCFRIGQFARRLGCLTCLLETQHAHIEVTWQHNTDGRNETGLTYVHGESNLIGQTSWSPANWYQVVFVGPFEHHSNLLPWREAGAVVVRISETSDGLVNLVHLTKELQQWQGQGRQLVGCFSAASNITGVLTDVNAVTILLHKHNALALWDYATAGAYVQIDMNPVADNSDDQRFVYKDAIFLSPHKFVGGVQTPGVLVAKKNLFRNPVPSDCGGGSVFFVRRSGHRYLQEAEMREEGGTPAIVESVRAGLVFQLKDAVGVNTIMEQEHKLTEYALREWSGVPGLVLLGPTSVPRLAIFSFLVRHPASRRFLHHNFVCTVLNDVFGIQARGGCACAGPYAEDLLGIDEDLAKKIENILVEDSRLDRVHLRRYREYSEREILRPGFVRLNLPYFASEETRDFVVQAVKMVAQEAWKLLPQYTFNPETGEWRHRKHQVFRDRKWLGFISYKTGSMAYHNPPCPDKGPLPQSHQECLQMAEQLFDQAKTVRVHIADQRVLFADDTDKLRWFLLPSEALQWLQQPESMTTQPAAPLPFEPLLYPRQQDSVVPGYQLSNPANFKHCFVDPSQHSRAMGQNTKCNKVNNSNMETSSRSRESSPWRLTDGKSKLEESRNPRKNSPRNVKDVNSDDRTMTTMAASLMAEGLLSALQEIQSGKTGDTETFRNVLTKCLSAGFLEDGPNEKDIKNPDAHFQKTDILNGQEASPGRTAPSDQSESVTQTNSDNPSVTENVTGGRERAGIMSENEQIGNVPDSKLSCVNGACFRKRETKSTGTGSQVAAPPAGHRWHPPNKKIFNASVKALEEFDMIQDGDRVLVCLSGGKDSLSLLHTLRQYQFYAKKKGVQFELGAVTIDPLTSSYDPSPLKGYLATLQVPYFYEEQAILEAASKLPECASICSFCSRMKRGRIYHTARREKYNVLAMGQHLDDLAESFLMSVFHNGLLRTMKASYAVQEGDLRVIRPFVYVREKDLREFADQKKLPVIPENCPACFEAPKERHRMKQLLAAQEVIFPQLFHSIAAAIKPVMAINKTGVNVRSLMMGSHSGVNGESDEES